MKFIPLHSLSFMELGINYFKRCAILYIHVFLKTSMQSMHEVLCYFQLFMLIYILTQKCTAPNYICMLPPSQVRWLPNVHRHREEWSLSIKAWNPLIKFSLTQLPAESQCIQSLKYWLRGWAISSSGFDFLHFLLLHSHRWTHFLSQHWHNVNTWPFYVHNSNIMHKWRGYAASYSLWCIIFVCTVHYYFCFPSASEYSKSCLVY